MEAREKRRIVVMLRWVLMIALSYLVVFDAQNRPALALLAVMAFLGSNLLLMALPAWTFEHPAFDPLLVVIDMSSITGSLWLCGTAGSDFFFLFFFVLFLSALGERPEMTALGALLAAVAYLCLVERGPILDTATLLRVPFLFITGLTYGYLASRTRAAQARARAAEQALGTMSDEMRTPLATIVRYSESLRADRLRNLTAEQREGIAKINGQAVELLELIVRRLLDIVDGKPSAEVVPTALRRPESRAA